MKITFENKIFQITCKYKAITLKTFSPLFYLKEKTRRHVCRPLTNIFENMEITYIIPVCSNYTFISQFYLICYLVNVSFFVALKCYKELLQI